MDVGFIYSRKVAGQLTIDAFNERHRLGLYKEETYIEAIRDANLDFVGIKTPPNHLKTMRPIFIGRRAA